MAGRSTRALDSIGRCRYFEARGQDCHHSLLARGVYPGRGRRGRQDVRCRGVFQALAIASVNLGVRGRCVRSARVRAVREEQTEKVTMLPNNALERTVRHRGPRLAAAQPSWPAAQLGR